MKGRPWLSPARHGASLSAMASLALLAAGRETAEHPRSATKPQPRRRADTPERRRFRASAAKQQSIECRVLGELAGLGLSRSAKHRAVVKAWKAGGVL